MRKRTISELADTLFWYLVYALPFIVYVLYAIRHDIPDLVTFMTENLGFVFTASNPVFSALSELFSTDGILPLFGNDTAVMLVTWFVSTYLLHLAVDFILFIPRLCHKWFTKCYQGD